MTDRKERLTNELRTAELAYDGASRVDDLASMRGQQKVAGHRIRVLQLRVELLNMEIDGIVGRKDAALATREQLNRERSSLLTHIKAAELSARAASKQATDDDLPKWIEKLNEAHELGGAFESLN